MSQSTREIAAAVVRSTRQRDKPLRAATGAALTSGYLKTLKARGAEVGIWEIRGRVFARVMLAARDAKLSGAETHVLSTIALHLQHLGRRKGMMTIGSLADDCSVDVRTIRNALKVLEACCFVKVKTRLSGQMTVLLDRRFGPRAPVPADKSADQSPRRSVPRKKISTIKPSLQSGFITDECKDSAPATARRESPASASQPPTATATCSCGARVVVWRRADEAWGTCHACRRNIRSIWPDCLGPPGHDPPRKRV